MNKSNADPGKEKKKNQQTKNQQKDTRKIPGPIRKKGSPGL